MYDEDGENEDDEDDDVNDWMGMMLKTMMPI